MLAHRSVKTDAVETPMNGAVRGVDEPAGAEEALLTYARACAEA